MRILFFFFSVLFFYSSYCQNNWASLIIPVDTFSFWVGPNNPSFNWKDNNFNDNNWSKGQAGFGYGDGDDATVIPNAQSVFIRRSFSIQNIDTIGDAVFHLDFDDGFVAYLNGVEIARENMSSQIPTANEYANALREATMYQGGLPKAYFIDESVFKSLIQNGKNTLTIQVHNYNATSSDLSCIPFLSVQLKSKSNPYYSTPTWFNPPEDFKKSHLPIVTINTNGQTINDEPEIKADMVVFYNAAGDTNDLTSTNFHYNGKITIELRGESSLTFPKKSYKVETKDNLGNNYNFPLMGFPEENDWIFYGPYSDKSLIRNAITFELCKSLKGYSSKIQFFELVINNQYEGIYLLMEQIKRDANRVDIAKLNPQDTIGEEITGGYIIRIDKEEPGGSPGFYSFPNPVFAGYGPNYFQYYDPKDDELNDLQKSYLKNYLEDAESSLNKSNFSDPIDGYQKYFDLPSFVDYHLINELTKNVDGYRFSTYFYKDKNDKIKAGPPWDFNLAYGNVDYWDEAYNTDGWIFTYSDRLWWTQRMLLDYAYFKTLHCRWNTLRSGPYSNQSIDNKIDSMVNYLGDAIDRNFERWKILGTYVWPNKYIGNNHPQEVEFVKNWIIDRAEWLDNQWTLNCPPTFVEDINEDKEIPIFPNPFSDNINFSTNENGLYNISVFDLLGKIHYQKQLNINELTQPINLSELENGIFLLKISYNNQEAGIYRIIKQ